MLPITRRIQQANIDAHALLDACEDMPALEAALQLVIDHVRTETDGIPNVNTIRLQVAHILTAMVYKVQE